MYATDIKQRFENKGFNTELIRYANNFSTEEFNKIGLCQDLIIVGQK